MELKNSTILITGGTSGIGLEFIKQLFAEGGNTIIATGRDQAKLERLKKDYPQVHIVQSDVSDPAAITQLQQDIGRRFPRLNIIINNAGIMRNLDLMDTELDVHEISAEIDIDLCGPIRMVQAFLPDLLKQPSAAIINISSGLAFVPFPISPVYSAAKAGLHAYTRVLRLSLKKTAINVFEIAPPATETALGDAFTGYVDSSQNMAVEKMVNLAIKGINDDKQEITPGTAKILKAMSRIAPRLIFAALDKSLQKVKAKNRHS